MKQFKVSRLLPCLVLIAGLWASLGVQASPAVEFFRAVNIDRPQIVRDLVGQGFDPNTLSEQGQTALYLALRDESAGVASALLDMDKVAVTVRNKAGETALMMAALKQNLPAMRLLLARGAVVNQDGWTPLHYAATGGNLAALDLLLAQGAALDARSPNGSTPLMMAARYGSEEGARLLLQRGAHPGLRNEQQLSAGDFARDAHRLKLAEQLDQASAKGR
jgi:uncharacterized protein